MEFVPIYSQQALIGLWPIVSKMVEDLPVMCVEDFTSISLYNDLIARTAGALLWMCYDNNGEFAGIVITKVLVNAKSNTLLLYLLQSARANKRTSEEDWLKGLDNLKDYALQANCSDIKFFTRRAGIGKIAEKMDFKHIYDVYSLPVREDK